MTRARVAWSTTEPVAGANTGSPVRSCSNRSSPSSKLLMPLLGDWCVLVSLLPGIQRLGHDRNVCDPRLFHGVHYAGKRTEWHPLVGAQIDHLFRWIGISLVQFLRQLVNI